jgi:hypothetical protein
VRRGAGVVSLEQAQSLLSLALGFALAGLLTTGYELVTQRPASLRLLQAAARPSTLATLPFVALAAPFIIMRTTIRERAVSGGSAGARIREVMLATIVAGFWSLTSGTLLVTAVLAIGTPAG